MLQMLIKKMFSFQGMNVTYLVLTYLTLLRLKSKRITENNSIFSYS